jgi:DNA-binding response OmpR family regulator
MMSAGADDFLKKPFNVHQLLEKLQNILAVEA